eukprot:Skav229851  [mRNA]  locus=scaffold148:7243:9276:- [translate_table: standard]
MAFIPTNLQRILADFDICGSEGNARYSTPWKPRVNLLLDELEVNTDGETPVVTGRWLNQEGGSKNTFMAGFFPNHADKVVGDKTMRLMLSWELEDLPTPMPTKMYVMQVRDAFHDWRQDDVDYVVDTNSYFIPVQMSTHERTHLFEAFSGGYGGWSAAADFLQSRGHADYHTVGIDSCMGAALMYSMTHACCLIDAHSPVPAHTLVELNQNAVLHGDFDSTCWQTAVSSWGVDLMTISAPCPAWSNASDQSGVNDLQGLLLPQAILTARFLRPSVIAIEQVQGFSNHDHKVHVLSCLKHIGYRLVHQQVLDAAEFGACHRLRWLGIAVRVHEPTVAFSSFQGWPQVAQCTPASLHAIFAALFLDLEPLHLTDEMRTLGSDPALLPFFMTEGLRTATPQEVWAARSKSVLDVVPTFMSLYGAQHTISLHKLRKKGYMLHFLKQVEDGVEIERLFHPLEILMLHLIADRVFLPKSHGEAWRHVGNLICLPQALIILCNVHNAMHPENSINIPTIFHVLLSEHLSVPHLQTMWNEAGTLYTHIDTHQGSQELLRTHLQHAQTLWDKVGLSRLEPGQMWLPASGIQIVEQFLQRHMPHPAPSIISPPMIEHVDQDEVEEVVATCPFQIMVKIRVHTSQGISYFWIATDQPAAYFQNLFSMRLQLLEVPLTADGCTFELREG